jgi:hypothetical protein
MFVGGRVVALRVLLCGRWCLLVFCSVFRGNTIIDVSGLREDVGRPYVLIFLIL